MAQIFNSAVMTNAGAALLARAQAGTAVLNFTAVVVGNGEHTDKSEAALRVRTSLLSQKQSFSISAREIVENVSVKMTATLDNEGLTTGYYLNEIGLLCQNGDDASSSTLFSIAVTAADHGDYFPAFSESGLVQIIQNFIVTVSNTANVTVAIGSDVYALASDLEAHESAAVHSSDGVHGLRFYNDLLQYFDETTQAWVDIDTGGGTTIVQIPTVTIGTYVYDGTVQGPTISGLDTGNCTVTGDTQATAIGSYSFTISLNDPTKMVWSDITTGSKTYQWTIDDNVVQVPTVQVGSYTYDGTAQGPTISGLDTDKCTVTDATATDAGNYTLTIALNDPSRMEWSDGTTAAKTWSWSIDKVSLTVPTVTDTSKTYSGSGQHPTVTGYDSGTMSRTGYEYTDAGDYTLSITLQDTSNYEWSDGTITAKTTAWSIAKAAGSVTLSVNSVTLDVSTTSDTVTISGATGAVTIMSDDTSIATVSPASMAAPGGTLTITSPNETKGTATITVNVAASTNYEATSATIGVTATFPVIYGVEWDGTSTTAWSRTDAAENFTDPSPAVGNGTGSSPFDDILPWSGMVKSERTGGTMVAIPKYYYKWTKTGNKMKLQISSEEFDGAKVSPAHRDRGDGKGERDVVYVGRYHCATSTYKSTTGVKPAASQTRANFRTYIHNLGSDIWQNDYAMRVTIWMLYLVEFADWNSQAKIGYGCGNNSGTENAGLTDAMQYHTGTNAANRTTYGHTQYRYIEDLWGNVYDWVDGIYFSSANVYAIMNPAEFSDTTGGTLVGTRPTASSWITTWMMSEASGFDWFIYPSNSSGGSDSTYTCDYCGYNASGVVLRAGGGYSQSQYRGLFYLGGSNAASNSGADIGSRLQELP